MLFDIRTAALDESVEQRILLAVSLLGAYRLRARLGAWDGTRCHLLIASSDDACGRQALDLAQRRGTPAIALDTEASAQTPAATLAKLIRERLRNEASATSTASPSAAPVPALCRLALPPLRGQAVQLRSKGRSIALRPQTGRAHAQTHSDLLADSFSAPDCELVIARRDEPVGKPVSMSLEAFLMRAAQHIGASLPAFPEGCYRLDAWPDLGALPSAADAMRIARLLIGNTRGLRELSGAETDAASLNTCLWVFAAADLLRHADPAAQPAALPARSPRMQSSLWASLARRFGLTRTAASR